MATLNLRILPAKPLKDGRHKIRVMLSHNSAATYIPTDCIIDSPNQFKDGKVKGRPDADRMNVKLRNLLNYYQDIIDGIAYVNNYSCSELRELLVRKQNHNNAKFSDAMNAYLKELKEFVSGLQGRDMFKKPQRQFDALDNVDLKTLIEKY